MRTQTERRLGRQERRLLALLGLPTFALALSITTVTTYLPVVAREFSGSQVSIGLIVAIEGLMALWVPITAGAWSDRVRTPWGGRLPFLAVGGPLAAAAIALIGVVRSVGLLAVLAAVFFFAYFLAYEPYRALYPDVVDDEIAGRAQSTQALWRGVGTGGALLGSGLLLGLATAAPFAAAAAVLVLALGAFVLVMRRRVESSEGAGEPRSAGEEARRLRDLLRDHPLLRTFLVANGLFELSLGALKTFIFLYLTEGLRLGKTESALAVGAAALFVLVGAALSGKLGDRYGRVQVLLVVLPVYAAGLLVPFVFSEPAVVAAVVPIVAVGGGTVMALPYALLTPLMPEGDHGALTGFYTFSRGIGTALGPLLAGLAITLAKPVFPDTHGYQGMWLVCALASALSVPVLRRLQEQDPDHA